MSAPPGTSVSLLVGPAFAAVPAPAQLAESIRSVQVTQGEHGSGFQLTFDVEPAYGASSTTGPSAVTSLLLKPYNRVVVSASLNGTPHVLVDGVITHLEMAPAQGGQPSTLTVTGTDLTAVMDLWEVSLEYPALDPELIVAEIILSYLPYGLIPIVIPSWLAVPPLPTDRVPIKVGTDLAYVRYLAAQYGYDFYITPGPLPLTNVAYWGPQIRLGLLQPALSVNLGPATNVDALTFSYDATTPTLAYGSVLNADTSLEVPVVGIPLWDLPPLAALPAVVVNVPLVRTTLFKHHGLTVAQAQMKADALVSQSTQDTLVATGDLDAFRYGAVLTARSLVGVRGAGWEYDGVYYVRSVTHTIGPGSWKQHFELVREGLGSTVPAVLP